MTRVYAPPSGPSITQQHAKDECDINIIMRKYAATGLLTHTNPRSPAYGDFSTVADYLEARNQINAAQAHFDALPSELRKRFANDPAELVAFCENPDNLAEGVKLGLVKPAENQDPAPPITNSPPARAPSEIPETPEPPAPIAET